jgi:glycosyltransferase involved in cell wall biosynthesis
MNPSSLRVLIVAEHASLKFGGEAALPLHYFRLLRERGMPAWLVVHERTRTELSARFPQEAERIIYIPDTAAHRMLWKIGQRLPDRLSYFSTGFVMRVLTQWIQRRIVKDLVRQERIDIVHQPIPVSPKEPSMIFKVGAPVVIGPMNGGMAYPPAFRKLQTAWIENTLRLGKMASGLLNRVMPGKRQAALLLVANERTRLALPPSVQAPVVTLVENGVDLSVWATPSSAERTSTDVTRFVFMGRLVDWKAVDLLLKAFAQAQQHAPMALTIIGDGEERLSLEALCDTLGLKKGPSPAASTVSFLGWKAQAECAQWLRCSDALVLSSLNECGGAVVLEAMALGLPVIASDWGGPADYLDEQCGILVPPDSHDGFVQGLSDAMIKLAKSPRLREDMGAAGRLKVLREFDWNIKMDRMLALYRQAIQGTARSAQ